MKRLLILCALGAFVFGGGAVSFGQERPGRGGEDRRGSGDDSAVERRERWERLREMSPEERRAAWREARGERQEEATADSTEETRTGLEFRSILRLGDETQFSIRDNDADRTIWLSEGEIRSGIRVVSYDEETGILSIDHDGEEKELSLSQSRVVEVTEEGAERERRREQWQERRAEFQEFRQRWRTAAETSPELQEIEAHFREAGGEMRELRRALRDVERGSRDHRVLRREMRTVHEELQLLSEYAAGEIRNNPAFQEQDVAMAERFARMMAFQRRGGPPRQSQ